MIGVLNPAAMRAATALLTRAPKALTANKAPAQVTNRSLPDLPRPLPSVLSQRHGTPGFGRQDTMTRINNRTGLAATSAPRTGPACNAEPLLHDAAPASPAAELLHTARALYAEVVLAYEAGKKSGNKSAGTADEARRYDALQQLANMQAQAREQGPSMWVYLSEAIPAGNCDELAKSVVVRALQQGVDSGLLYLGDRRGEQTVFDHVAALVAPDHVTLEQLPATLTFDESAWQNVLIVDPWAELVCAPSEYITRYADTMDAWDAQGMQLMNLRGDLVRPTDPSVNIGNHEKTFDRAGTAELKAAVKDHRNGWRSRFIEKQWKIGS
ncbi:hypothetical protein [Stenotrophomonas sp. NPDC077659]|uniref:hypothetical protein n=1 Tax=Stenotrophomonas sp. NPDC077659 TaxID=3390694 RepID=UPI003D093087